MDALRLAVFLLVCVPMLPTAAAPPTATKIVLLGTGTPRPAPERSGPATAIVVGDRAYLIDFGPGVVRRASAAAAKGIGALEPTKITVAFVTHLHSDHTAGYPDLLLSPWVLGRTAELNVYGPEGLEEMTRDVLHAWRRDIDIRTNGLEHRAPLAVRAHDVKPGVVYKDDRVTVTAFLVPHGEWPQAFGYRFDTPDRSIVLSGDTSPSDEVVAQCHGCDVLIHEAYSPNAPKPAMEDWDAYRVKYHTSTAQLAEIAARAKPALLILYHQSGRAPDAQMLDEVRRRYPGKVVIAHDLDIY
ncbi:MAG TPA: MBL fold metallo-hydrolase [Vicinamibacterales bacterium]|nr:MBL fold metallo-hydrolase [Vicinamibacterales bacterium]